MSGNAEVSLILYLFDRAFEGGEWHSLIGNLKAVKPEDWLWVPPNGVRSIRDIVEHVGGGNLLYHHYAFGSANLHWDDPSLNGGSRLDTVESAIDWLRENHALLHRSIEALSDEDLHTMRPHFRGQPKELRWIIATMTEHNLYHAGEINHIRCLHQGDDE